jgi:hypothetical protein
MKKITKPYTTILGCRTSGLDNIPEKWLEKFLKQKNIENL